MTAKKGAGADGPGDAGEIKVDALGQLAVPLDGADWTLRPSRLAISTIERELGRPLFELAQLAARGSLPIEDMAVMVVQMMRAHAVACPADDRIESYRSAKPERIADLIYEAGSPKVCVRLMVILSGALNGGFDATGEAKPAPVTTKSG